jgi:AcrR family transcriptional regulator
VVGTKDRIIDAAVELMNRSGVGSVTTNHIAAHLGMSPGNLYYHFKNKEEIIRAAFDRMNVEAEVVWRLDPSAGVNAVHRMLTGNLGLYAKYLFFARELPALLRSDATLRRRYRKIHKLRIEQLEDTLLPLIALGILKNLAPADLMTLIESSWVIGLFGLPYSELAGRGTTDEEIVTTARMVMHLFKPYMEPFAYAALVELSEAELRASVEALPLRATS